MNKEGIAGELLKIAKNLTNGLIAKTNDIHIPKVPTRVGMWKLNESRMRGENFDGVIEYVAKGNRTILFDIEDQTWEYVGRDYGRFTGPVNFRRVNKFLKETYMRYGLRD